MAAIPPQPAGPPIGLPLAPILSFIDRYRQAQFDTEADSYRQFLLNFDPMSNQGLTSAELLDFILHEPDDNSRAVAVHWQDPADRANPGRIVVLHGFKKYPRNSVPAELAAPPGTTRCMFGSRMFWMMGHTPQCFKFRLGTYSMLPNLHRE
jgi:hypothetical protein